MNADECMHVACEGVQVNADKNVCMNVHACTTCVGMTVRNAYNPYCHHQHNQWPAFLNPPQMLSGVTALRQAF